MVKNRVAREEARWLWFRETRLCTKTPTILRLLMTCAFLEWLMYLHKGPADTLGNYTHSTREASWFRVHNDGFRLIGIMRFSFKKLENKTPNSRRCSHRLVKLLPWIQVPIAPWSLLSFRNIRRRFVSSKTNGYRDLPSESRWTRWQF
jgi:hypothetical protein